MAKQSTYTGMGATLVKGAGELYRSSNKSFAPDVSAGMAGATQHLAGVKAARQAKLANIESKAANYIGQMESMDSSIVDEAYRGVAEEAFMGIKNDYWETTMMLKNMDTSHPDYMETRSHLNQLNSKAKKIASVFSDLAKNKKEELSFISNRNYSAGNDPNKVEFLNNVLTGSSEIKIDEGGNVLFKNNDSWTSYENLPDIAAYDATSFDSVLTTLDGASKLKRSLTDTDRTLYESKIRALLKKGGKNTAISLGSDDFIVDGGMGLGGEEEYDANPDAYQQRIVDSYMSLFENAANEGYQEYQQALSDRRDSDPKQWEQKLLGDATLYQNINEFADSGQISDINNIISVANRAVKGGTFRTGNELARILLKQGGSKEPSSAEIEKAMNDFGMNSNTLYLNDDYEKGYPIDTPANIKSTLLRLYGISPKRETEINIYTGGGTAAGDSIFQ